MPISPSIMTTYGRIDIAFTHGEGSFLISEDGKDIWTMLVVLLLMLLDIVIQN